MKNEHVYNLKLDLLKIKLRIHTCEEASSGVTKCLNVLAKEVGHLITPLHVTVSAHHICGRYFSFRCLEAFEASASFSVSSEELLDEDNHLVLLNGS